MKTNQVILWITMISVLSVMISRTFYPRYEERNTQCYFFEKRGKLDGNSELKLCDDVLAEIKEEKRQVLCAKANGRYVSKNAKTNLHSRPLCFIGEEMYLWDFYEDKFIQEKEL